jgi:hypothetical protein
VADRLSSSDLATLSLLDPEQGVCPNGHRCRFGQVVGHQFCKTCGYEGMALICWNITFEKIDRAAQAGSDAAVVSWGRAFVIDRDQRLAS